MPTKQSEIPLHILLVEDNEDDVAIAKRVFAKSGVPIRLHVANDGKEALELLAKPTYWRSRKRSSPLPDLALLDLSMPRMGGLAVLRHMKADPGLRTVPVIVLTGETDEYPLRECMQLGTNMYLLKPMAMSDVVNIVLDVQRHWTEMPAAKRPTNRQVDGPSRSIDGAKSGKRRRQSDA
ncbi:MAG: response regulator [Dehalococcoidia bacterium]